MIKKLSIALIAMIAVFGIAPAQAEEQKTVAIIDGYFDTSLIDGDVVSVCVVSQVMCARIDQPRNASQFKNFNHGTIMADIVRQNNPGAKLVLIRAATVTTGVVNGATFDAALDWIIANKDTYSIDNVSFSYNVGNGTTCRPTASGVNIHTAHNNIVNDIATLKSAGVIVYAAAGNHSTSKVDYPACIPDVVSVGSTIFRGSVPFSDIVLGPNVYRSNVLKSNRASLQDSSAISRSGVFQAAFGATTSVTTAIVAATN